MAKITRYNGDLKAFGSNAQGTERTVFGDTSQSDDLSANVNTDFQRGWRAAAPGVNDVPTIQDFNGAMFTHGQLLSYLHQMGVAEWNSSQEYYAGSVCTRSGKIYVSRSTNTNKDPDVTPADWSSSITQNPSTENLDQLIHQASIDIVGSRTGEDLTLVPNSGKVKALGAYYGYDGVSKLPDRADFIYSGNLVATLQANLSSVLSPLGVTSISNIPSGYFVVQTEAGGQWETYTIPFSSVFAHPIANFATVYSNLYRMDCVFNSALSVTFNSYTTGGTSTPRISSVVMVY